MTRQYKSMDNEKSDDDDGNESEMARTNDKTRGELQR